MEHVRGKLVDGDKVLHEDLDIALNHVETTKGSKQYMGCFQVQQAPKELKTNGPFQLHLDDGRVGSFTNPRIQPRPAGVKVSFTLDGSPRKDKKSK